MKSCEQPNKTRTMFNKKKNQSELIACNMDSICKMKIENSRHEANMQCSDKTKKNRKKNNRS